MNQCEYNGMYTFLKEYPPKIIKYSFANLILVLAATVSKNNFFTLKDTHRVNKVEHFHQQPHKNNTIQSIVEM